MCVFTLQVIFAQWSKDPNINNTICTAINDQQYQTIVSDGAGGAIISWMDFRNSSWTYNPMNNISSGDIYAQHISSDGTIRWTTNGIAACTTTVDRIHPMVDIASTTDGAGGVIIVWRNDYPNTSICDIYAQRINSAGVVQWTTSGVAISSDVEEVPPSIASDGRGGVIISWRKILSPGIYAQRINSEGAVQWTTGGVVIVSNNAADPSITSDGAGGAIITWQDFRSGMDIYAQRISADGTVQWMTDGVAICTAAGDQAPPAIVNDGAGSAIIAWVDKRSGSNYDIYAQRISAGGTVQWTTDGVAICTATGDQLNLSITNDGAKGVIITWFDYRGGSKSDIYAQRINSAGVVQWTTDGVAICTATDNQYNPTITSDGTDGAIITWEDHRNVYSKTYAQRINSAGTVQWAIDGIAISTATSYGQSGQVIVSDGQEGAIVAWKEDRNYGSYLDIYAQRINRYGCLGNMYPDIHLVKDIPNDQGGKVAVLWDPPSLDVSPYTVITSYTIYRGLKESMFAKSMISHKFAKTTQSATGSETIYWENYATAPSHWLSGYSSAVSTLSDSTASGNPMYYFMVTANTSDATVFWDSPIDSGYSVDNLSPSSPGFPKIVTLLDGAIQLSWKENTIDSDVGGYVVYRSESGGFPLTNENKLAITKDTLYVDASVHVGKQYYYSITTEDIHGNQSTPTIELSDIAIAVELTAFTVSLNGLDAELRWNTATEVNNYGFEVERRTVNNSLSSTADWIKIGFVQGAGTSNAPHNYSFTDQNISDGIYTYRLKQIDNNGAFKYSQEMEISIVVPNIFSLNQNYPNPFNPSTTIQYSLPARSTVRLVIYNTLGQVVKELINTEQQAGVQSVIWNANVASGLYFYRLEATSIDDPSKRFVETKKMLLLK
jgi:predicted lipoprotein with Yx(FWY)xxD motif